MSSPRITVYKRVILKIGGEAFCQNNGQGIDINQTKALAQEILSGASLGTQLAIVVGGGNIIRGAQFSRLGIDSATADYMGMLATVVNALSLQDVLEKMGAETRLLTAIPIQSVAEPFIRRRCVRHLEKGRIVILAAGTGNPHFTTDTAAALRATEISAQVLLKATKVDGVYSSDPTINPKAIKYDRLSYMEFLKKHLSVMDATAITMCMEHHIPIIVFSFKKKGNIVKVLRGEKVGTIIS